MPLPRFTAIATLLLLLSPAHGQHYQTKTPYQPPAAGARLAAVPRGYHPVHTQLLARHGSRGLSSMKLDLALYNLLQLAKREQGLTALGAELEGAVLQMMQANALLGYGVAGISKPGYGNETMQGIQEHRQLAQRMYQRMAPLFRAQAQAQVRAEQQRQILVLSSGKDRAVDSAEYFAQSLFAQQAGLQAHLLRPQPLTPLQPQGEPANQTSAGVDRFLLYFHKLSPKTDLVSAANDPLYPTYQASLAYQNWLRSEALQQRLNQLEDSAQLARAAQAVLQRLFKPAFLHGLAARQYQVANRGSMAFTSQDGQFSNRLEGDGETVIDSPVQAALALYELYAAAADMQHELARDWRRFMPRAQAAVFAEHEDGVAFYSKGPGLLEHGSINYAMAQTLLDDFFAEVTAIAAGDTRHLAKLRFAHAEIVIPLAALLGIRGMSEALPARVPYSYKTSPWRGERVAPMAANIQWDTYQNEQGQVAVRMLYNERPVAFKSACAYAKLTATSQFYDFSRLRRCYQGAPP